MEEVTEVPEGPGGRVKTINPRTAGGILYDSTEPEHAAYMEQIGALPIQLVVNTLYPFADTVASGASPEEVMENIDVGGVTLVRSALKSPWVTLVTDPRQYHELLDDLERNDGHTSAELRERFRADAAEVLFDDVLSIYRYFVRPTASGGGW